MLNFPISEPLSLDVYQQSIKDGTEKELKNDLLFIAKREDSSIISLDHYWLFMGHFSGEMVQLNEKDDHDFKSFALKSSIQLREKIRKKREKQINKISNFLEKALNKQYEETLDKLEKYHRENDDNRYSALINQMNANLLDIEMKREERMKLLQLQGNIGMKPPKRILQLEVVPNGQSQRVISTDYKEIIEHYERLNGRKVVNSFHPYALVDFYSERFNGEERFIIVTNKKDFFPSEDYLEDLMPILEKVYIYNVKEGDVVEERAMANEVFLFGDK